MLLPRALQRRAAAELERRANRPRFDPARICFPPQQAFVADPARFKVACCSRRAGKTVACAVILLTCALERPDALCLYLTLSRVSGKRIVWRTLTRLNREFGLGGQANYSELTLTFPNGSTIFVGGAKDESEIEKYRGSAYDVVVIDEAQAFRAYLEQLIDDVVVPALVDRQGSLVLIGTPWKVRAGYFYEATRFAPPELREMLNVEAANDNAATAEDGEGERIEWAVHHWTIRDNPHIPDVEDELARIRRRKGWTDDNPTYQREFLGRWVTEHSALVYKYDPERNGYDHPPAWDGPEWRFTMAVNQGYVDADAIYLLAWRPGEPWVWAMEMHLAPLQTASQIGRAVAAVYAKVKGRLVGAIRWDEGGGGKKVSEDVKAEHRLPIEAAEKPHKIAGVERVNELLRTGVLKIQRNSQAAADASRVTWDPKARGVKFSERYHTDAWDAILYAVRAIPPGAVMTLEAYEQAQRPVSDIERERAEREARIRERVARAQQPWVERVAKRRNAKRLMR